jgi:YidC/Oxa1 family membrane protein insertase
MQILGGALEFFYKITGNYGVAIILLTLATKIIVLPSDIKQKKSSAKIRRVEPLMRDLKAKYKNDKQKLKDELAELYKKNDINPTGSCLGMIFPLVMIIALFAVIRKPIIYIMGVGYGEVWRLIGACNSWAAAQNSGGKIVETLLNLNVKNFAMHEIEVAKQIFVHPEILNSDFITPDLMKNITPINFNFLGLDLSQTPSFGVLTHLFTGKFYPAIWADLAVLLIPLFTALTTFASSKIIMKSMPQQTNGGQNPANNTMMQIMMPLMTAWFTLFSPAGLGLYMIISNLFQLVEQILLAKYSPSADEVDVIK